MPEVSIKEQIKKFVEIQAIDFEIFNIKKDLKEKPAEIEEFKNQFEQKKANLNQLEEKLKSLVVERKGLETELESKDDEIAKSNTALSQLKTNKEYQAKITEIENIKADKSRIEEKILLSYDEVDKLNADVVKEKEYLAEEEKKFQAQKKEVDDLMGELQQKVSELDSKRKQLVPELDKTYLIQYERILENRDGLAIVPVEGTSCGGCFMNVTPQTINKIKMNDELVTCEVCNRILYLKEDIEP